MPQIKILCAVLGVTQTKLAERLGVSRRAVQYWEAGDRVPGGSAVKILIQLLDEALQSDIECQIDAQELTKFKLGLIR